jgi:hypothetical protein
MGITKPNQTSDFVIADNPIPTAAKTASINEYKLSFDNLLKKTLSALRIKPKP